MRDALVADTVRGPHSTGIFWVNKKDTCYYLKKQVTGAEMAFSQDFVDAMGSKQNPKFVCGHNRWATKGAVNQANAHPFSHDGITGVHNGTLTSYAGLQAPPEHKGTAASAFDTDSETVFYTLSQVDDVKEVIRELEGAFVLVWHDTHDNCVRMVRNDKRPLYLGKIKNRDTLVYASEKEMLEWCVHRRKFTNELEWVKELPVGEIWRFDMNQTADKRIKPHVQQVTVKKPQPTTAYNYGATHWKNGGTRDYGTSGSSTSVTTGARVGNETVDEFIKRHGLKRSDELYGEVFEVRHSLNTVRISAICEIGDHPINTVCWVPRRSFDSDLSDKYLVDNIGWTIGKAVGMSSLEGEAYVVLKMDTLQVMDNEWEMLFRSRKEAEDTPRSRVTKIMEEFKGEAKDKQRALPVIDARHDLPADDGFDEDDYPFDDQLPAAKVAYLTLMGPHGVYIPKDEWFELTSEGCVSCHGNLGQDEHELLEWDDENRPICHHCQGVALH